MLIQKKVGKRLLKNVYLEAHNGHLMIKFSITCL